MKTIFRIGLILIGFAVVQIPEGLGQNKGKNDKGKNSNKGKDKDNNVNGIKWDVEISENGSAETARFRATPAHKIFLGAMDIGTWEKISDEKIKAVITQGKLKGEMEIVRTLNKPPTYKGNLKRSDGSEAKVKILFRDD